MKPKLNKSINLKTFNDAKINKIESIKCKCVNLIKCVCFVKAVCLSSNKKYIQVGIKFIIIQILNI